MTDAEARALADAMRDAVTDPVVPPALADRVGESYRRRRRRRGIATVAAVACVVGVVVVASTLPGSREARPPATTRPHDRLGASGVVLAAPGQPVRFCPPHERRQEDQPPMECLGGVPARGVHLAVLTDRRETGGVVWGRPIWPGPSWTGPCTSTSRGPRGPPCPTTASR